ncbi:uncharacterized protein RSE6_08624 [Rhynchosporium secalis]|uniref:Uncharacterized protein n=1 Tax=Rhynchosporium secalis TaxID=38038 RepID=A0A1E1MFV4_RHYSE|nr:uncharacterized protein RSE6_08624 [Rhynchosporium secalis]
MDSDERKIQRAASVPIGFLGLPDKIRINIFKRVLVVAQPIYLFQDKGSQKAESFAPERPHRWLALLYTNRQIHDEASMVLYGANHFTFMDTANRQGGLLQSFFNCIGSSNAGLLSRLCINFPIVEYGKGQSGKVMLGEDEIHSLRLLKEHCAGLTTLETLIYSRNYGSLINAGDKDSKFIREALSQIDAQLKAISSLQKVIVRYYDGAPTTLVVELMQGFGWVVLRGR